MAPARPANVAVDRVSNMAHGRGEPPTTPVFDGKSVLSVQEVTTEPEANQLSGGADSYRSNFEINQLLRKIKLYADDSKPVAARLCFKQVEQVLFIPINRKPSMYM